MIPFVLSFTTYPEKAMASNSCTLAWKIPWTEEPGRLQSMGSLRVGPDWATSLSLFTFMHWRRKWQPTPVFLPGESQGRGSLVGCRLWGRTESDTTEATSFSLHNLSVMVELKKIMVPSKVLWTLLFVGNGSLFESIKNTKVNSVVIPGAQQKQN